MQSLPRYYRNSRLARREMFVLRKRAEAPPDRPAHLQGLCGEYSPGGSFEGRQVMEEGATKRTGTKLIKTFSGDEFCVSMIEFDGELFIATNKHIYKKIDDKLHKLELKEILEDRTEVQGQ